MEMQVDDTAPPIIPPPPVLADIPVAKPTFVSGLATSMHAPGNTMDTSVDPSPNNLELEVNPAQK